MKFACCALLLLSLACNLSGQESVTPDTAVNSAMLHQWLHSGDPRLVAWAADFARRTHDAEVLSEIPAVLESSLMPQDFSTDESQAGQRRALLAMLDALIQENSDVPIQAIEAVAPTFPAQAAILIVRHPLSKSRDIFDYWASGRIGTWGDLLARIAAMTVAKDPVGSTGALDQSFVASVVAKSENELRVTLSTTNSVGGGIGVGACGDSFGRPLTPGWPQIYSYRLGEERDSQAHASIIVELDGDRIFYWRIEENAGWGSCTGQEIEPLNSSTRHRLIAYWLGVHDNQMPWQPIENFTIVWTNEAAYKHRLSEILESQRKKLVSTVASLQKRGLLNESEAKTVCPKLVVTIQCNMKPCPI